MEQNLEKLKNTIIHDALSVNSTYLTSRIENLKNLKKAGTKITENSNCLEKDSDLKEIRKILQKELETVENEINSAKIEKKKIQELIIELYFLYHSAHKYQNYFNSKRKMRTFLENYKKKTVSIRIPTRKVGKSEKFLLNPFSSFKCHQIPSNF